VKHPAAVIDTNVVVAGLITADAGSPTARILDGMRRGTFPFLLSDQLLAEYREVLLRAKIRKLHGLAANEVDHILTEIATHAIVRAPAARSGAPDAKDNHLWSLLLDLPGSVLVTGDLALGRNPPPESAVLAPRDFVSSLSR
jgi:putative PIN family toxin of toxin-antitoxin system